MEPTESQAFWQAEQGRNCTRTRVAATLCARIFAGIFGHQIRGLPNFLNTNVIGMLANHVFSEDEQQQYSHRSSGFYSTLISTVHSTERRRVPARFEPRTRCAKMCRRNPADMGVVFGLLSSPSGHFFLRASNNYSRICGIWKSPAAMAGLPIFKSIFAC